MRVFFWAAICLLAGGVAVPAQQQTNGQGQIVIPADEPSAAPQGGQPMQGGTELIMKPITVQGQHQLRGRFGPAWAEGEVKQRAAITCAEAGMRLVYFKPEAPDSKGRREFAVVCQ